jgi:hypothetical protein
METILGSIDYLDFEEEFEKLEHLDIKKLIGKKTFINNLHKKMNANTNYLTPEQELLYKHLYYMLDNDYPIINCTDKEKEINKNIRLNEIKCFKKIARANNLVYVREETYEVWIEKIQQLINKNKTYDHKEYMNEKIICECGTCSIRKNLSAHKKSQLHIKRLAALQE